MLPLWARVVRWEGEVGGPWGWMEARMRPELVCRVVDVVWRRVAVREPDALVSEEV